MLTLKPNSSYSAPTKIDTSQAFFSDSLLDDIVNLQQRYTEENGVTSFIHPKTGGAISAQEYWAQRRFESQPGFIIGKILRDSIDGMIWALSNTIGFCIKTSSNTAGYISNSVSTTIDSISDLFNLEEISEQTEKSEQEKFEMTFTEKVKRIYEVLSTKIDEAIEEAKKSNKPLLILIGEVHDSESSIIIESIILEIAAKKLNLKTVLTESFMSMAKDDVKLSYKLSAENTYTAYYLDVKINEMGLKTINLDLALCDKNAKHLKKTKACKESGIYPQNLNSTSSEGIKMRNTIMAEVASRAKVDDSIAVVGSAHLYGLIKETTLSERFYIFPINTWDCSLEQCIDDDKTDQTFIFDCLSEEVLQISIKEREKKLFFSTEQLIQRAHHILEKELSNKEIKSDVLKQPMDHQHYHNKINKRH